MVDPDPAASADEPPKDGPDGETPRTPEAGANEADATGTEGTAGEESLREAVEAKYDFERFGPADMAEMSIEEWQAVFDPDTWITGPELIDRVEAELGTRVADRELFAVVERHTIDAEPRLLAYTDASYAVVHPDGTVVGEGGILGEIEPVVAVCSMDDFEVATPPPDAGLPNPERVETGSGELGHRLLLTVAGIQLIAGLVLLVAPIAFSLGPGSGALTTVLGLAFLLVGLVMGVLVANARLSDRFRAAAYRDRLRAAGVGSGDRPAFLPPMDGTGAAGTPVEDGAGASAAVEASTARTDDVRGVEADRDDQAVAERATDAGDDDRKGDSTEPWRGRTDGRKG